MPMSTIERNFSMVKTVLAASIYIIATRYFQGKMSPALTEQMRPVVDTSLTEVGAIQV